jgi:hypothetical protein
MQAFRPGAVEMTEEQLTVNPNLITMQDSGELDLEFMMGDPNL